MGSEANGRLDANAPREGNIPLGGRNSETTPRDAPRWNLEGKMMVGEFYKRLIVGVPTSFPQYYELVRQALKEANEEFPTPDDFENYPEWRLKWFGLDFKEKSEDEKR